MGEELRSQLSKNPNFVLQVFLGTQPQTEQAVNDLGLNLEDYGRKGKGSGNRGSRGKGKGKRSPNPQKKWERQQGDDEEENKDYMIKLVMVRVPLGATVALIGHDPLTIPAKAPRTRDGRITLDQLETANRNP